MNKKKKTSRLKHRKNQERMKNIIRASRLKAKPKKVEVPKEIEPAVQAVEEVIKPPTAKKAPAKKAPQIRSPRNGMDMVEQMMSDQNLSLEEFRSP